MEKINFYVTTSNGFNDNVVVEKYYDDYDGVERFSADVETVFGTIMLRFTESDFEGSSIEDYLRMEIGTSIECSLEIAVEEEEEEIECECKTISEYEIAVFDKAIDDALYYKYVRRMGDKEAYDKAYEIKDNMKFEKCGDCVRMIDEEDGIYWDNVDEAVRAIIEKVEDMYDEFRIAE